MNENLFRPQFDTLKLTEKLWLMQTLATRYHLTFKELSCVILFIVKFLSLIFFL